MFREFTTSTPSRLVGGRPYTDEVREVPKSCPFPPLPPRPCKSKQGHSITSTINHGSQSLRFVPSMLLFNGVGFSGPRKSFLLENFNESRRVLRE